MKSKTMFQKEIQELLVKYYKQALSDNVKRGIETKKLMKARQNDRHN